MCVANGFWTVAVWKLLPDMNWHVALTLEFVLMLSTTAIALFGFVRGTLALRVVYAPARIIF